MLAYFYSLEKIVVEYLAEWETQITEPNLPEIEWNSFFLMLFIYYLLRICNYIFHTSYNIYYS